MIEDQMIIEKIEESFKAIRIVDRYVKLSENHNDFNNLMKRMDKRANLDVLKKLGYTFKIFTPGQHYNFEESFKHYKIVFSCQISGGIIAPYIYVYANGHQIPFKYPHFGFISRFLMGNMEAKITASVFGDLEEFEEIMKELLSIYEDFKTEFLKRVKPEMD